MADNLQIVLNAFETLFNKRDYTAAENFWSPNYIQHSAHIPPGREGLFALIKGAPKASWSTAFRSRGTLGAIGLAPLRPPASRPARSAFAATAARTSPKRSRPIVSNICRRCGWP